MKDTSMKVGLREKMAYGLGDFASSMFWKLFSMFLLFFYTDIFGISAAAVGTMFLVTRVWDAANDPLMGIISDRTQTRWGKFRPFLLFGAIPFGIVGVLTFTTPDLDSTGKLIYAYVTYTLMMMAYTAVNVPYGSLLAVISSDSNERTALASWRFIGAYSGGMLVTSTATVLVAYFSEGTTQAQGYQTTIALYAVVAAILFGLTFLGTKERLIPTKEQQGSLKNDLKDLAKNKPWFIMLAANICILIFMSLRDGSILFYFKYYVQDQTLSLFGTTYQLTTAVLSSVYMTLWLGSNIIGVVLAKPISARLGKKKTFGYAALVSAFLSMLFFFLEPSQIVVIFGLNVFIGISAGLVMPLGWSMYADIADYSEWKTGRRATGLVFSSSSMSQKFGWTLGGALSGWILAAYGFEANQEQTELSLLGIRLMFSVFAAAGAFVSFLAIQYYKLDEKFMEKVNAELNRNTMEE
ncbi:MULTISPECIES: MFS transporter [Reichenbachiella]|uniref:MFS transporter n=1 Tax=Reichenbachiella TaxID=156993 RepID=UPI000E6C112F|nr:MULTISPECIES: MFS transporter [Reichenbachiella]MBU2914164.1 MFS transporter [Reichenbachiella agariperforans]RJE72906.1 cation transporter [Reichenbachiella sp. MSK19-1]